MPEQPMKPEAGAKEPLEDLFKLLIELAERFRKLYPEEAEAMIEQSRERSRLEEEAKQKPQE